MNRRKYLATISTTVSGLALAGCSTNSGSSGDGGGGSPTASPTPTSTPSAASKLSVGGFVTASGTTAQAEIKATNPTNQSVTADFSAKAVMEEDRGVITSETVEKTIPAGESKRFRVDLFSLDEYEASEFRKFVGYNFIGFTLSVLVNGEVQAKSCPDTKITNPTKNGCKYPFGLNQTRVEIEYEGGSWKGALSTGGSSKTISRSSIPFGAPEGYSTSYIGVSYDASIISVNAQKQSDNSKTLTIRIVHKGKVVAEKSTSAAYGVVQVSETL